MLRTRVATHVFVVSSALWLLHCADKASDERGPLRCGAVECRPHQLCGGGTSPSCMCDPKYTGVNCDACAPGYSLVGGECEANVVDCSTRNPCGTHGTCVEQGARDRCECSADHEGPTCAQCVEGKQDKDQDGTCAPACGHGELSCLSWEACDDSSGTVRCGCAPHSTGRHCDECESGYYRLADGPCVKYCGGSEKCPGTQTCREVEGKDAACSCPLGSTGDDCKTCESGFAMRNGACTRAATPGHLLLGAKDMNRDVLYDFDPQTKVFTALRSQFPSLLISDATKHELWAGESVSMGWTFGRYDLATNVVSPLSASHPFNTTAAFDPTRRAVFWVIPDDVSGLAGMLTRFDVDTGMEASVAHVDIRSSDYLTYDAKTDRLIGTHWDSGLVLVAIDPRTGALATLGKPAFETNGTNPRLATDAAGQIYLLSAIQRTAKDALRDMLVAVFERIGLPSLPATAPVTLTSSYYVDPSKPVVLVAQGSSGSEVVAYDSYGGSSSGGAAQPMPVQLAVNNPDAVISLTTFSATLRIQVPADARFKTLFVYGGGAHTLELAPGFSAAPGSIVMVGSKLQLDALEALSPAVRAYSIEAAQDRRAPVSSYYDDTDDFPPLWLVRVDPATQAVTLVQRMPDDSAQALTVY